MLETVTEPEVQISSQQCRCPRVISTTPSCCLVPDGCVELQCRHRPAILRPSTARSLGFPVSSSSACSDSGLAASHSGRSAGAGERRVRTPSAGSALSQGDTAASVSREGGVMMPSRHGCCAGSGGWNLIKVPPAQQCYCCSD